MSKAMIIDSHQHVFWHGRNDAGLIADMDEWGIDKAWLLSWETPPGEDTSGYHGTFNPAHFRGDGTHLGLPLSDVVATRDRYPDRFIVGHCPHPRVSNAAKAFEAAYRIHGARVCGEWKCRILIDDPRCIELFRAAGELGCPVVLHLDPPYIWNREKEKMVYHPEWYGGTMDNLERALEACRETNFIGHAPGFWRYISGDADKEIEAYPSGPIVEGGRLHDVLRKYDNLYADMSATSGLNAMKRYGEQAKSFVEKFADRLLFGRDYYGGDLIEFLKSLNLTKEVAEKIYYKNAQKLLGEK